MELVNRIARGEVVQKIVTCLQACSGLFPASVVLRFCVGTITSGHQLEKIFFFKPKRNVTLTSEKWHRDERQWAGTRGC